MCGRIDVEENQIRGAALRGDHRIFDAGYCFDLIRGPLNGTAGKLQQIGIVGHDQYQRSPAIQCCAHWRRAALAAPLSRRACGEIRRKWNFSLLLDHGTWASILDSGIVPFPPMLIELDFVHTEAGRRGVCGAPESPSVIALSGIGSAPVLFAQLFRGRNALAHVRDHPSKRSRPKP